MSKSVFQFSLIFAFDWVISLSIGMKSEQQIWNESHHRQGKKTLKENSKITFSKWDWLVCYEEKQQIERIPAALVRICFDGVLGSPTPTLLIANTLNS